MPSLIRLGASGDVRALVRMHAQSSAPTLHGFFLAPLPTLTAGHAATLLCPPGGFSLVTERDETLAGIITVQPGDEGAAVAGLWVSDHWHRRGIGTALLLACAREAAARGFDSIMMSVMADNRALLPMINSAGLRAKVVTRGGHAVVTLSLAALRRTPREAATT